MPNPTPLPQTLDNGLILRRSTRQDAQQLADFNARIHGTDPQDAAGVAAWTLDLFDPRHPTFHEDDFTLVEEASTGKIVSAMNLIDQTWTYGGLPFSVGRPELVGTDSEYRRRGLIRRQFEIIHALSQSRGQSLQIITGIPNYYRQFGYGMALDLGGGINVSENVLRPLREGETEPFSIRPARVEDVPDIMECMRTLALREPLLCQRDAAAWRYEIEGKRDLNVNREAIFTLVDNDDQVMGVLGAAPILWKTVQAVHFFELKPGNSYLAATPVVLRWLWQLGQQHSKDGKRCLVINLRLGRQHPAYCAVDAHVAPMLRFYAYYMRVPDLPAFLRYITPVLEQRLANSLCAGHSGELTLSFYTDGLRLVLDKGRITAIEPYQVDPETASAAFTGQTFLQLLFQNNSMEELRNQYADVMATRDGHVLLDTLFPKTSTHVWALS